MAQSTPFRRAACQVTLLLYRSLFKVAETPLDFKSAGRATATFLGTLAPSRGQLWAMRYRAVLRLIPPEGQQSGHCWNAERRPGEFTDYSSVTSPCGKPKLPKILRVSW